jgi:hypothetical protein
VGSAQLAEGKPVVLRLRASVRVGVKGYLWYCVSERALGLGLGLGLGVGVGVKGYLWYCVSERAWSTSVRASAERPLMATPMCESTW